MAVRHTVTALTLAAALLAGCGSAAAPPPAAHAIPRGAIALHGCYMTVHVFGVDRAAMRAAVPARYSLGDYAGSDKGTLAFWVIACGPSITSLVGVQVHSPVDPGVPAVPATFDHYMLYAQSNDAALVARMRAAGMPATLVPGITFTHGSTTVARIPWSEGPYMLQVRGEGYEGRHNHDNNWWFDAGGAGASRMEIHMWNATDRGCASCSSATVTAGAGSPIAQLIGGTSLSAPVVAFDHNRIPQGAIAITAHVPVTFPASRPEGYLGVIGEPAPGGGVQVTASLPGTPAAQAGIRVGDTVLAVNGHPVSDLQTLSDAVRALAPGTRATVTLKRGNVSATLTRAPG